jgi:tryptophan halogenase
VVALGLSSGFVEPLESTSIHLIVTGVVRLIQMFPGGGISQGLVDRYNDEARSELEHVRDFIILHYHANRRDEPMWRACRELAVPDMLARRIALFRDRAHVWLGEDELFRLDSWIHVMLGQGVVPQHHHPLASALSDEDLRKLLASIRQRIDHAVAQMPPQQAFIERYCRAAPEVWAGRSMVQAKV